MGRIIIMIILKTSKEKDIRLRSLTIEKNPYKSNKIAKEMDYLTYLPHTQT